MPQQALDAVPTVNQWLAQLNPADAELVRDELEKLSAHLRKKDAAPPAGANLGKMGDEAV